MDAGEVGEVERCLGESGAGGLGQPLAQCRDPVRGDRRPDRDAELMWHRFLRITSMLFLSGFVLIGHRRWCPAFRLGRARASAGVHSRAAITARMVFTPDMAAVGLAALRGRSPRYPASTAEIVSLAWIRTARRTARRCSAPCRTSRSAPIRIVRIPNIRNG